MLLLWDCNNYLLLLICLSLLGSVRISFCISVNKSNSNSQWSWSGEIRITTNVFFVFLHDEGKREPIFHFGELQTLCFSSSFIKISLFKSFRFIKPLSLFHYKVVLQRTCTFRSITEQETTHTDLLSWFSFVFLSPVTQVRVQLWSGLWEGPS